MKSMIVGEYVQVIRKAQTGKDEFNEPIWEELEPEIVRVVVDPSPNRYSGSGEEPTETARIQGSDIVFTCHFPKTYTENLTHADVIVRGFRCRVIGDPEPYESLGFLGKYNRPVKVRLIIG